MTDIAKIIDEHEYLEAFVNSHATRPLILYIFLRRLINIIVIIIIKIL